MRTAAACAPVRGAEKRAASRRAARLFARHCVAAGGAPRKRHTQSYCRPPSAAATSGCLIMPRFTVSQLHGGEKKRQVDGTASSPASLPRLLLAD